MRDLKASVMSYEEFMLGALDAFEVGADAKRIHECFEKRLQGEVKQIQHALFGGFVHLAGKIQNALCGR